MVSIEAWKLVLELLAPSFEGGGSFIMSTSRIVILGGSMQIG